MGRISHYEDQPAFYIAAGVAHPAFSSATFQFGLANNYVSFFTDEKLQTKNYL